MGAASPGPCAPARRRVLATLGLLVIGCALGGAGGDGPGDGPGAGPGAGPAPAGLLLSPPGPPGAAALGGGPGAGGEDVPAGAVARSLGDKGKGGRVFVHMPGAPAPHPGRAVPSWKADPDSENYTWPNVHSYCIPCKTKKVGTCFLSGCYPWRGETECVMTRCVCASGFCAKEDAIPGQEQCVPQICIAGPRPEHFHPKLAVRFFWWLGGKKPFPTDLRLESPKALKLIFSALAGSAWLFVAGMIVIMATFVSFCLYMPPSRHHRRRGGGTPGSAGEDAVDSAGPLHSPRSTDLLSMLGCRDGVSPVNVKTYERRPSIWPLLLCVLSILVISFAGISMRDQNLRHVEAHTMRTLMRFKLNAITLRKQGRIVDRTSRQLNDTLKELTDDCSKDPLLGMLAQTAQNSLGEYIETVHRLYGVLRGIPRIADKVIHDLVKQEGMLFWLPLAPVLIIAIVSTIMLVEAIAISIFAKSKWGIRLDRMLRFAFVPYALMIFFVCCFGAAGFILAIVLSSYCADVDANTIDMVYHQVKDTNHTELYQMARFYITGSGLINPVMNYVKTANNLIDEIYDVYMQFEGIVKAYYPSCHPLEKIKMEKIAKEARTVLKSCNQLLEPRNIYPYYRAGVRQAVCTDLVGSLAGFPVFTLVLGLAIFPYGVVLTHRYLVRWAWWKQQAEGGPAWSDDEEEDGGDEDSEESSDEESGSDDDSPRKPAKRSS